METAMFWPGEDLILGEGRSGGVVPEGDTPDTVFDAGPPCFTSGQPTLVGEAGRALLLPPVGEQERRQNGDLQDDQHPIHRSSFDLTVTSTNLQLFLCGGVGWRLGPHQPMRKTCSGQGRYFFPYAKTSVRRTAICSMVTTGFILRLLKHSRCACKRPEAGAR